MKRLRRFRARENLSASKLNEIVDTLNMFLDGLVGDTFIKVSKSSNGIAIGLNWDVLLERLPVGGGGTGNVIAAMITAVQEDNTPECEHKYKTESVNGDVIDTFTAPTIARDPDTLYLAASVNAQCLMWQDADEDWHFSVFEAFDTVLDS